MRGCWTAAQSFPQNLPTSRHVIEKVVEMWSRNISEVVRTDTLYAGTTEGSSLSNACLKRNLEPEEREENLVGNVLT